MAMFSIKRLRFKHSLIWCSVYGNIFLIRLDPNNLSPHFNSLIYITMKASAFNKVLSLIKTSLYMPCRASFRDVCLFRCQGKYIYDPIFFLSHNKIIFTSII